MRVTGNLLVRRIVRRMKKVFIILLFCTTIIGQSNYKPTMSLLEMKSSEILSDSEGNPFAVINVSSLVHPVQLRQLNDFSFRVLE